MLARADAWARRDEPNVVLVHYDDLFADLEGEMRRLADRLGIAVPEERWPELVGRPRSTRCEAGPSGSPPTRRAC